MIIRYSTYALCLLAYITLGATCKESLQLSIHTENVAEFESSLNEFLVDASISTQEKQDTLTLLATTVKESRVLLEQEAALSTGKTTVVKGTAQLIAGLLACSYGFFSALPTLIWELEYLLYRSNYGSSYFVCKDQSLRLHMAPYFKVLKITKKIFENSDNEQMYRSFTSGTYLVAATSFGVYAGSRLCINGYHTISHNNSLAQKIAALDAIEQLLVASTILINKEIV